MTNKTIEFRFSNYDGEDNDSFGMPQSVNYEFVITKDTKREDICHHFLKFIDVLEL